MSDSLISGNSSLFTGGGIEASITTLTMIGSTLSGNTSASYGGALHSVSGSFQIAFSTITANMAPVGVSGGIYATGGNAASRVIRSSIVAGNTNSDLDGDATLFQSAGYNLIGTGNRASVFNQLGDQTGVTNPQLGALGNNGGPTKTHALLVGSPAIDAGDPAAVAGMNGVPLYDQRGTPYARVYDGDGAGGNRIDIGAVELQTQPLPSAVFGDYNGDGAVDGGDYVLSRKTIGANVTPYTNADGNGSGTIGPEDYDVWRAHIGATPSGTGSGRDAISTGGLASDDTGNAVAAIIDRRGSNALAEPVIPSGNLQGAASIGAPGQAISRTRTMDASTGPLSTAAERLREDALLLNSSSDGQKNVVDESDASGNGQDCPSYGSANDGLRDAVDLAFETIVSNTSPTASHK